MSSVRLSGKKAADHTGSPGPTKVRATLRAARSMIATEPRMLAAAMQAPGRQKRDGHRKTWSGVMLAIVSAVTYGTGAFWLGTYAASAGWLVSALVVDIIAVTVLAAALICKRERLRGGVGMAWAIAAGLAESAALVAFARGGQAGQIALTAGVSSTYPLIPLAFGLVLFRERLSTLQVMGVCVAVTGLTLVSMSSGLV